MKGIHSIKVEGFILCGIHPRVVLRPGSEGSSAPLKHPDTSYNTYLTLPLSLP